MGEDEFDLEKHQEILKETILDSYIPNHPHNRNTAIIESMNLDESIFRRLNQYQEKISKELIGQILDQASFRLPNSQKHQVLKKDEELDDERKFNKLKFVDGNSHKSILNKYKNESYVFKKA